MKLRLETSPEAIRAARRFVAAAMREEGCTEQDARAIEVALGEALSNARQHAYHSGVGPVEVDMDFDDTTLSLRVHDDGRPVTPIPLHEAPRARDQGGRGLLLIMQLMDEAEIASRQGTELRMRKRVLEKT